MSAAVDALRERLQPGLEELLVASDVAEPRALVGWLVLVGDESALTRHWARVLRVQSDPAARGGRVGRALMTEVARRAREDRGSSQLHLELRSGMGLETFCAALGWRVVGTWPGALRVGEHDVRDEVLMVLDLTGGAPERCRPPPAALGSRGPHGHRSWATARVRRKGKTVPWGRGGYAWRSAAACSAVNAPTSVLRRLEHGAEAGASDLLQDRVVAGQDVQVPRLPDVSVQTGGGEQVEVGLGLRHRRHVAQHAVEPNTPAVRVGELARQGVRGSVDVRRHLDRDPAAVVELAGPPTQEVGVLGHPLQGGVADQHVDVARVDVLRLRARSSRARSPGLGPSRPTSAVRGRG